MLTIQDVSAEQLAKLFHHYREALDHDCGGHGKAEESSWDRAPQSETQGNGGCGTLDAARTSHATSAAYSRLQVLRHAG